MNTKQCRICGEPSSDFYTNRHGRADSVCKPCRNAQRRENHQRKKQRAIRRTCQGCGRTQSITCYPRADGAVSRSLWCIGCTRAAAEKRRQTTEHSRHLESSARIARTDEEIREWVDEAGERLREATDAVRPVLRGEGVQS